MNTEDKSDFFINQLHEILLKDWDPKNIQKKPEFEDEYDSYIEDLLDIFAEENASQIQIVELLLYVEDTLSLKPNEKRAVSVADKIWQAFEEFIS